MYFLQIALALFLIASSAPLLHAETVSARLLDDRVQVSAPEGVFTEYSFLDSEKYPYFFPVNGPQSGESVTTQTSEPYPHHHSLFFGCDRVSGGNYWQDSLERGRIDSEWVTIIESGGPRVVFTQSCLWVRPDAPSPFRDSRRVTITAPSPALRLIDFDVTLIPLIDVTIEKTNHSLFSARVVPELSVERGGLMINREGLKGEKETFGQPSGWIAYGGKRDGAFEGIAILDNPANIWHPSKWFTRDYGFFSPTNMNWIDEPWHIERGHCLRFQYRVVVFTGSPDEVNIEKLYEAYSGDTK
ncbi:MAG: hypothetical protein GC154_18425 [bacterium]|nr:hypothetical protein [bacterium]